MFRYLKNWLSPTLQGILKFKVIRKRRERKMSQILKEMAMTLLKDPGAIPSSEAGHAALLLAHVAWNRSIGETFLDASCRSVLREFEKSRPSLWKEFNTNDWKAMIEDLINYKEVHYPDDRRVVVVCGMRDPGFVRVEWRYQDDPHDL